MKKTLIVMAILAILLAACVPGQTPQQTQDQINTAVAAAIATQQALVDQAVALTLTSVAQNASPTPVATIVDPSTPTALVFPTLTPVIPTNTPLVVNTQPSSGGGGGGGVPAKKDYACDSIDRQPYDNTVFNKGADFDIKWTIVNTGTKTWPIGQVVKYFSGPKMTSLTKFEIPKEMKPNAKYELILDAVAPTEKGFQVMTWTVNGQLCYPYVAIIVK